MIAIRYFIGFIVAIAASSVAFLLALEATAYANPAMTPSEPGMLLFLSMFVVPFALVAGLLVGIPVFAVGYGRGWFDTIARSALTGAVAGVLFTLTIAILLGSFPLLWEWFVAGAIAGAVAGGSWRAIIPAPNG